MRSNSHHRYPPRRPRRYRSRRRWSFARWRLAVLLLIFLGLVFAGRFGPRVVYYPNCAAARAASVAPINRGEPGYRDELDADGDGIACEPYPLN